MGGETIVASVWEKCRNDCSHLRDQGIFSTPIMKVLVVCLGNICRSPMGEAVLRHIAKERNIDLTVDSAGTAGYHIDEEPDRRSVYLSRVFARH